MGKGKDRGCSSDDRYCGESGFGEVREYGTSASGTETQDKDEFEMVQYVLIHHIDT